MGQSEASYISIARITKTQGLKGEVRIELLLEDDALFEKGRGVVLFSAQRGSQHETEIEFFRRQHGRCIAKFRGIDSISQAESLVGNEIKIPKDALPAAKEGWFYTFQLKGCEVFTTAGEYVGIVTEFLEPGGVEVLKVDRENEETLIPFAQQFLKKIDLEQRRIEVDLPEGLRELNK